MGSARFYLALLVLAPGSIAAQAASLASDLYRARPDREGEVRLFEKSTRDLVYLEARIVRLTAGTQEHGARPHGNLEELVVVTEGSLAVTLDSVSRTLNPGDIAVILPGARHRLASAASSPVTFYILGYRSRLPPNPKRGRRAGGSITVDLRGLPPVRSDSGTRHDYLERPTSMLESLTMQSVALRARQADGPPHQHRSEELILVVSGSLRVRLGEKRHQAMTGDLLFAGSALLHSVENAGDGPAEFLSVQWR